MVGSSSEQVGTGSTPASADTGGTEFEGAYASPGNRAGSGMYSNHWGPPLRDLGNMIWARRITHIAYWLCFEWKRNKTLGYLRLLARTEPGAWHLMASWESTDDIFYMMSNVHFQGQIYKFLFFNENVISHLKYFYQTGDLLK